MKPRSAAIVACRIIALFVGIEAVTTIISFLLLVRGLEGTGSFWAFIGTRLVVAVVLWVVADRLGEVMARGTEESAGTERPILDLEIIAFTVVGVVMAAQAIPSLIEAATSRSIAYGNFSPLTFMPGRLFDNRGAAVAGGITRLGLGLALIFGARPLAVALERRDRGAPPAA